MYCPNCKQEHEGKFCPECGTKLIEKPAEAGGFNINLGDANAISGGINLSDSHNVHKEDHSVHNTSNVSNVTTNVTNVAAQKTDMEILQEKKTLYLNECKRAYEDNVLEQSEVIALEECRIKLGLDKVTADAILDSVRIMTERNARKTSLNPIAKTKLKILTDNLKKNEVKALMDQIDGLEALVKKYEHDDLSRKYFLVLAALKPEKCIELKENSKIDSYWKSFWSYVAYIKTGRISEAENIIVTLDLFADYPEDNMTVLAVAGALMQNNISEAKEYLSAVAGDYTPALQCFVDSIYLLLDPDTAKEMNADENTCAFYLVNFFGQKDSKTKAEEEARLIKEIELRERAEEKRRKTEFPYSIFWIDEGHDALMLTCDSLYELPNVNRLQTVDDVFNAHITREAIDNPMDVMCEKIKSCRFISALYPTESNPFDCMAFCTQNNIPTEYLYVDSEIQMALAGAVKNYNEEAVIEYRDDTETFYAESGGGVLEMLADTLDGAGLDEDEITIHINSNAYHEDIFRGCLLVHANGYYKWNNDIVCMTVSMSEVNLISKQNGGVRNVTKLLDKFEIEPCKIIKDILVDGDSLCLGMYNKLYEIPLGRLSVDDKLQIGIKLGGHGDFVLFLRKSNIEVCYRLIGNKFQEIEKWHFDPLI